MEGPGWGNSSLEYSIQTWSEHREPDVFNSHLEGADAKVTFNCYVHSFVSPFIIHVASGNKISTLYHLYLCTYTGNVDSDIMICSTNITHCPPCCLCLYAL